MASTHEICVDAGRGVVTKRFRSRERREPEREWAALELLAEFAPGLAPAPIRAQPLADPAVIEMSWLPGAPLGETRVSAAQRYALAEALGWLWAAVPPVRISAAIGSAPSPCSFTGQVRLSLAAHRGHGTDPVVDAALQAGADWLAGSAVGGPDEPAMILGHGDPNLANFLCDGTRVRIVDFEDCGISDRAFELAILVEHISAWAEAGLDAEDFLALFDLASAELGRVREFRRLAAMFWLLKLSDPARAAARRSSGNLPRRQAERLLDVLG
ncbi:MAG TPA: aminoglycoside phosphotransferase family protein [Streptosporangiaceae bacterium]|nr:aminoglycoside phosphotransferase family protein [Streptosporangiaceae bacterium]